jgi:peptidyl-prolyl cis-trans isomerase C
MVPAFDKVVFTKPLNEIHGPVATPFGYHLIYINEREEDPPK